MKTISIVNLKGGVGKTITAVNMAAILATEYGKRVLLIDADHQGNSTRFFRVPPEPGTLADLLEGTYTNPDDIIQRTIYRGLDVIPADMSLASLDIATGFPREEAMRAVTALRDALSEDDSYDYMIVDCPPAFSIASISAIAATDDVVIPIKPGMFEQDGVAELTAQIEGIQMAGHNVHIAGCLLTMWHNADVVLQGENWLRANTRIPVFIQHIRRTDKVDESTYAREPICQWSPTSAAARDYRAWIREYLGGELDG